MLYGMTMRGDGVTRVISQRMEPAEKMPITGGDSASGLDADTAGDPVDSLPATVE